MSIARGREAWWRRERRPGPALARALALSGIVAAQGCGASPELDRRAYLLHEAEHAAVIVDGDLGDRAWRGAAVESGFSFPWRDRPAPPTEFRALADDTHLYFVFRVVDADVVVRDGPDETAVAEGDRVELFFAADPDLQHYVCLEIDPHGRVFDYEAAHYRRFDVEWDMPGVLAAGRRTDDGYVVEGGIPLASFGPAGLPSLADDGRLLTGIFRAEFSHPDGDEPRREWISWIVPDSAEPDFHVPAFGWMVRP